MGSGFYDRLLGRAGPGPLRAALAFECQVVEEVPMTAGDERMDLVVTENDVLTGQRTNGFGGPAEGTLRIGMPEDGPLDQRRGFEILLGDALGAVGPERHFDLRPGDREVGVMPRGFAGERDRVHGQHRVHCHPSVTNTRRIAPSR